MSNHRKKAVLAFADIDKWEYTGQPKLGRFLFDALLRQGYEISLLSNCVTELQNIKTNATQQVVVSGNAGLKNYLRYCRKIQGLIGDKNCRLIVVHGALLSVFLFPFMLFNRVRYVISICEIVTMHPKPLQKLIGRVCKGADSITVTSEEIKQQLRCLGVPVDKIKVNLFGVSGAFEAQSKLASSVQYDVIFWGDAKVDRGFDIIFELAKARPEYRFIILIRWVSEECRDKLREAETFSNVDVKYYPYNSPLADYVLSSKVVLLPFRFMGFRPPLSIAEAMTASKVVFTSTMAGNEQIITHQKDGFLFEVDNGISEILPDLDWMIADKAARNHIGRQANSKILSKLAEGADFQSLF